MWMTATRDCVHTGAHPAVSPAANASSPSSATAVTLLPEAPAAVAPVSTPEEVAAANAAATAVKLAAAIARLERRRNVPVNQWLAWKAFLEIGFPLGPSSEVSQ